MSSSDHTPPDGLPAALRKLALDIEVDGEKPAPDLEKYGDPTVAEVPLGGITPRVETPSWPRSGDLYIRLEGQISGPFRPERLESLLSSGILTGLEEVSVDLNHWTPLAYHPRIVRGRVPDLKRVHRELKQLSELPARKDDETLEPEDVPLCAVVKRPKRIVKAKVRMVGQAATAGQRSTSHVGPDDDTEPDFNRDRSHED